ncbi:MAG: ribonuclease P protein component [Prevotella sp.]|nr:ribonuclease P protein component [Prevotella sp.]
MAALTLRKRERLCSMRLIDRLFNGAGSHSTVAFPMRVVWSVIERQEQAPLQIMVSVSKRHFKHAVKRNRVKRQIREAYRLNKQPLAERLDEMPDKSVIIGFIWLSDELQSSAVVAEKMRRLIRQITEKL